MELLFSALKKRTLKYIYWFAYYHLDSPSVRYRAKYPLDFAKENLGIPSRLIIPGYSPKRLFGFLSGYLSALLFPKDNSIIVIQRVRSNFIYSNLLKVLVLLRKGRAVYDLDDADYLEHNADTIHFYARNCRCISAGSEEILKYLKQFNENVFHITSPTPDLGIIKTDKNEIFTIGWVGGFGRGHEESLYQYVFPAIRNLNFSCKFILIGVTRNSDEKRIRSYFRGSEHVQLEFPGNIDWNDESALQTRISQFDVGVATLLNQPVQLAKSGIKAKQYLNNGIPVLCNDLPENNKVVVDGLNGFVCRTAVEFEAKLVLFKEMADSRYWEFSANARRSIKNFNHFKYFEDFEKVIMAHQQNIRGVKGVAVSEKNILREN